MNKLFKASTVAAMFVAVCCSAAFAQSRIQSSPGRDRVIEEYTAYIGEDDLYNSNGDRLKQPWQIIRQDRANFHRYGKRDRLDQGDSFFDSANNRERMESMLRNGSISRSAARAIVNGDVVIHVRIIGSGSVGRSVEVTVDR